MVAAGKRGAACVHVHAFAKKVLIVVALVIEAM
jgi:hypothetical protein